MLSFILIIIHGIFMCYNHFDYKLLVIGISWNQVEQLIFFIEMLTIFVAKSWNPEKVRPFQ